MSIIPNEPWMDPPDDWRGHDDPRHAHECRGCKKRVMCYADGCGFALYFTCGACWVREHA